MQRHEEVQIALDCAIHGLTEPEGIEWRKNIPAQPFFLGPDGRGYFRTGRSNNIDTMAVAAWVCFVATGVAPKKERVAAVRMAADLLLMNKALYLGNEFGSTIYTAWTVMAWLALAWALASFGEAELAKGFQSLVAEWLALARASLAKCPANGLHVGVRFQVKDGKFDVLDESKRAGRWIVTLCGERSWGHGHGVNYYHHDLAAIAFGLQQPVAASKVAPAGRLDKWLERATVRLLDLLRACARPAMDAFDRKDWRALAALMPYAPGRPCELRLYEDDSCVFTYGGDEPEPKDESLNNTPSLSAIAVYRTPPEIVSLPAWPAPNSGATRIRQEEVKADIDRDIHGGGWLLRHSHVGDALVEGWWLSKLKDPTARVIARFVCFGAGDGWAYVGPQGAAVPLPPAPPGSLAAALPPPASPSARKRRCRLCDLIRLLFHGKE